MRHESLYLGGIKNQYLICVRNFEGHVLSHPTVTRKCLLRGHFLAKAPQRSPKITYRDQPRRVSAWSSQKQKMKKGTNKSCQVCFCDETSHHHHPQVNPRHGLGGAFTRKCPRSRHFLVYHKLLKFCQVLFYYILI